MVSDPNTKVQSRMRLLDNDLGEQVASLPHRTIFQYPFQGDHHINLLENIAKQTVVRRFGRDPATWSARYAHLLDSRVVLGVSAKGRSSSRTLNCSLRKCAPTVLLASLYPCYNWISTKFIPADDPSRDQLLPAETWRLWWLPRPQSYGRRRLGVPAERERRGAR